MIHLPDTNAVLLWGLHAVRKKEKIYGYLKRAWDAASMQALCFSDAAYGGPDVNEIAEHLLGHMGADGRVNLQIVMGDLSFDIGDEAMRGWNQDDPDTVPPLAGSLFETVQGIRQRLDFATLNVQLVWMVNGSTGRAKRWQHLMGTLLERQGGNWVVVCLENFYQNNATVPEAFLDATLCATVATLPTGLPLALAPGNLYSVGYAELNNGDLELACLRHYEMAEVIRAVGDDMNYPQDLTLWRELFRGTGFEPLPIVSADGMKTLFQSLARALFPIHNRECETNRALSALRQKRDYESCDRSISEFFLLNRQMCEKNLETEIDQALAAARKNMETLYCHEALKRLLSPTGAVRHALTRLQKPGAKGPESPQRRYGLGEKRFGLRAKSIDRYCDICEAAFGSYAIDEITAKAAALFLDRLVVLDEPLGRLGERREAIAAAMPQASRYGEMAGKYPKYLARLQKALADNRGFDAMMEMLSVSLPDAGKTAADCANDCLIKCDGWLNKRDPFFNRTYVDVLINTELGYDRQLSNFINQYLGDTRCLLRSALPVRGTVQTVYLADDGIRMRDHVFGANWKFPDTDNIARLDLYPVCEISTVRNAGNQLPAFDMPDTVEPEPSGSLGEDGAYRPICTDDSPTEPDAEPAGTQDKADGSVSLIQCPDGDFIVRWIWPLTADNESATVHISDTDGHSSRYFCPSEGYQLCPGGGMRLDKGTVPYGEVRIEVRYPSQCLTGVGEGRKHEVSYARRNGQVVVRLDAPGRINDLMARTGKCYYLLSQVDGDGTTCAWPAQMIDEILPRPKKAHLVTVRRSE